VHENVVHFDRTQRTARHVFEHALHGGERLLERQVARRTSARRAERCAARTDLAVVELHLRAVEVAREQHVQRIGPSFERIGHRVMHHRSSCSAARSGNVRQLRHVRLLHAEAHARARQQQEERLAESLEAVHVRERAVEHARVVRLDRGAAELQRAHGRQNALRLQRGFRFVEQRAQRGVAESAHRLVEHVCKAGAVHVHHARERFIRRFAAAELFARQRE
jgi:hypothetical protein